MAGELEPRLIDAPSVLSRVASLGNALRFSWIDPFQAESLTAGNRFDVPGGGVLYASTEVEGAYAETLARLRPSPAMLKLDFSSDPHHMRPGNVARDWRLQRRKYDLALEDPLPFVDVEHKETRAWLTHLMAADLERFGIDAIDVDDIRGKNRLLTREVAKRIYTSVDGTGSPRFSGIRYMSRIADYECWAIFDGTEVMVAASRSIEHTDRALLDVARRYGLTIHR